MNKFFTFSVISILFSVSLSAQVSYNFTALTGTYTPITGGTVPNLVTPDITNYLTYDEGFANGVPIGFPFVYNGIQYNNININANGFITLGEGFAEDPNETYYVNSLSAGTLSQNAVRPIIAPLWDDLLLGADDSITYLLSGVSPNRVLTIQWANAYWDYNSSDPSISFQLKLYETTNVIEFIYRREFGTPTFPSASIGLSSTRTGTGNLLSLSNSSASPAISTTADSIITLKPATNQVYRFTPAACIAPGITQLSNATSTSATFSWNAVPGAAGYEYAFSTSATPPASGTATSSTTVDLNSLTAGANNFLYVRTACGGGSFSAWSARVIVETCTQNITPANGATVPDPPSISWDSVKGATAYTIMLSSNGTDYTNIGSADSSSASATLTALHSDSTYFFYVRPVFGSDTASESCNSNATSFTVGSIPCTTNILPANGATVNDNRTVLKWNAVTTATDYDILISNDSINYFDLGIVGDTSTSVLITGFDYATTYYYYIRPIIGADTASGNCKSNATSFTTFNKPPIPPNDSCGAAIAISPNDGVIHTNNFSATPSPVGGICPPAAGDPPSNPDDDVWFKFTPQHAGSATISVTGEAEFDAVLSVYTGDCSNLTLLNCSDTSFGGELERLTLDTLQQGETYYVRVYDWGTASPGYFTISISGDALPVTMSELHGEKNGDENVLTWATQTELNSKGFEIQRSADGNNFNPLNFIASEAPGGNSAAVLKYTYIDTHPLAGSSFYRLKQSDKDGKFVYSNIILLQGPGVTQLQLNNLYPNPSGSVLNVLVASPANNKVNLVVTDLAGKMVLQQNNLVLTGSNNLKVNVANLSAGSYFIKLMCANGCGSAVRKFVKE